MASCASWAVAEAAFRPRLPSGSGPTSPDPKSSVAYMLICWGFE